MKTLVWIYLSKIAVTVLVWCVPLLLFPDRLLAAAGIPSDHLNFFVRLLGWAYLALCVGYGFGLAAARRGEFLPGPAWTGIVSNGGACALLLYFGLTGAWSGWGMTVQAVAWASIGGTALITVGLLRYALRAGRGSEPVHG